MVRLLFVVFPVAVATAASYPTQTFARMHNLLSRLSQQSQICYDHISGGNRVDLPATPRDA